MWLSIFIPTDIIYPLWTLYFKWLLVCAPNISGKIPVWKLWFMQRCHHLQNTKHVLLFNTKSVSKQNMFLLTTLHFYIIFISTVSSFDTVLQVTFGFAPNVSWEIPVWKLLLIQRRHHLQIKAKPSFNFNMVIMQFHLTFPLIPTIIVYPIWTLCFKWLLVVLLILAGKFQFENCDWCGAVIIFKLQGSKVERCEWHSLKLSSPISQLRCLACQYDLSLRNEGADIMYRKVASRTTSW